MDKLRIIGAGLAGLLAACKWPEAVIYEARPVDSGPNHKALLRFRSDEVSKLTGIPFREVRVDKAIWSAGGLHKYPNIYASNAYARKVVGRVVGARSIWNLDSEKRWIAPQDFEEQLIDRHANRIVWSHYCLASDFPKGSEKVTISTMPMSKMLDIIGLEDPPDFSFEAERRPIFVRRYRLPKGTDVHQTIYFPDSDTAVYRASITGDLLIIEEASWHWACSQSAYSGKDGELCEQFDSGFEFVARAFGFEECHHQIDFIDCKQQEFGKIVELPREQREAVMYELTRDYNIFSLGRFATWRNILLDDVVKDMEFIDRLMNASFYGRHKLVAKASKSALDELDDKIPF